MTLDYTKVLLASGIDTFKNEPTISGSISVPGQSYTAGQYRTFSTTIALERTDAATQILQNYSFQSTRYYSGAYVVVNASNFQHQTRMYINGSTLYVDLYVINQIGSTNTLSAYTLNIEAKRFVGPFE